MSNMEASYLRNLYTLRPNETIRATNTCGDGFFRERNKKTQ